MLQGPTRLCRAGALSSFPTLLHGLFLSMCSPTRITYIVFLLFVKNQPPEITRPHGSRLHHWLAPPQMPTLSNRALAPLPALAQ